MLVSKIEGCFTYELNTHRDSRGEWLRVHDFPAIESILPTGDNQGFSQVSISTNRKKGTLRGLHFLEPSYGETKHVSVFSGSAFDVVVDLRKGSDTFGKHVIFRLASESTTKVVVIPPGCAHGFQTLEDGTSLCYAMSVPYDPTKELGINALDPFLDIRWPLEIAEMSPRDQSLPNLNGLES